MSERCSSVVALTVLLTLSLGCDVTTPTTTTEVRVGTLDGTDGMVAIARSGTRLRVYTCGGASTVTTHTGWTDVTLAGDAFTGSGSSGLSVQGTWSADAATGTLTVAGGGKVSFTARAPSAGTPMGLYVGPEAPCRTGLIVGGMPGSLAAVGAWCDGAGVIGQVVPILPIAEVAQGVAVRRTVDPATVQSLVQRLTL